MTLPQGLVPTAVYDTYWRFAAERQAIFFRRLTGAMSLTKDSILAQFKFTNAYRASDRVSQFLIKYVQYQGDQSPKHLFFRTLLFKFFNRIETWKLLENELGEVSLDGYTFKRFNDVFDRAMQRGERLYSAAYIMPAALAFGGPRKHATHLRLLEHMIDSEVPDRLVEAKTLAEAFKILRAVPMLGDFLAFQYLIDLNYTTMLRFDEMDFVVPGPGARDGIRKCFVPGSKYTETDIIRIVADHQEAEFEARSISFQSLWGRRLHLIDCQNLFCEVDKYARVAHPDVAGISGRTRIKQAFIRSDKPVELFYPPKWGINERVQATTNQSFKTSGQLVLPNGGPR